MERSAGHCGGCVEGALQPLAGSDRDPARPLKVEEEQPEDHDHMCTKFFLRESWSWSLFFSSSEPDFQKTMTICAARLLNSYRLFLSQFKVPLKGMPS